MTDTRPILVVGATGMLGRPVAERLVEEGRTVRVLARDPARAEKLLGRRFEYYTGDVSDPASLDAALAGCAGVHVNLRGTTEADLRRVEVDGTEAVARAAKRAGVDRLTYLSGAGIESADAGLLPVRTKRAAEAAIRASGVPYAILRATHFMESLDLFVRGKTATILGDQPRRFHYLAAADYARQAARALVEPAAAGKALTLLGPQAYTMREALDVYVRLSRPDLKVTQAPLSVVRLVATLKRDKQLKLVTDLFRAFRRIPETGDRTEADRLLGPATTTLEDWCRARAVPHEAWER